MAQAVGLQAGLEYLQRIGLSKIHDHEMLLTERLINGLSAIEDVQIFGPKTLNSRGGVISFSVSGIHPHDLGQFLDNQGIAVRTGHHCAWPLNKALGVQSTTRASFYLYNLESEIDVLLEEISSAQRYFGTKK